MQVRDILRPRIVIQRFNLNNNSCFILNAEDVFFFLCLKYTKKIRLLLDLKRRLQNYSPQLQIIEKKHRLSSLKCKPGIFSFLERP